MKHFARILTGCMLIAGFSTGYAASNSLNLAGTYQCTGTDSHDGSDNSVWTLTLDPAASDATHNMASYSFISKDVLDGAYHSTYTGNIVAQGNALGIYFQNNNSAASPTDHGVGVGVATQTQDAQGKITTSFSMNYYQPEYMRSQKGPTGNVGGTGTNNCVKVG